MLNAQVYFELKMLLIMFLLGYKEAFSFRGSFGKFPGYDCLICCKKTFWVMVLIVKIKDD